MSFSHIQSVAIIGASEDPKKIWNILLKKNQSFSGNIYGINPRWWSAYGFDFYHHIADLPETPDVAVFAIPEKYIYDALIDAGKYGIKKAIIITAGFKEIGNIDGEARLQKIAKEYSMRILWPNCLWFSNTWSQLDLSFWGNFFRKGNIGIISQSWAMAVAITDVLDGQWLGFSTLYTLGNKSDLDETDILEELANDPHTTVIALYLENIARGKEFIYTLKKVTQKKPVIIMLGWMSTLGKKATVSHTGSLSGEKKVYEQAIKQGGGIYTYSLQEYFDIISAISRNKVRPSGRTLIVTNAWWPWVLATDQCEFQSILLDNISDTDAAILRENMPQTMSTHNPVDIIGDADSHRVDTILYNITKIRNSADILFIFTIQATTDIEVIAEKIIEFQQSNPSFFISIALIGWESVQQAKAHFEINNIPTVSSTEALITTYRAIVWEKGEATNPNGSSLSVKKTSNPTLLSQDETEHILKKYRLFSSNTRDCTDLKDIEQYTQTQDGPYVLKVGGKHIAHKTELWGVFLWLTDFEDCKSAYNAIIAKNDNKSPIVSIARHVESSPDFEFFFWAKRDATFGEIFVIGAGGIYLSLLADSKIQIGAWETHIDIHNTIKSLRSYPALTWYRGKKPVNIDRLTEMLTLLVQIFLENTTLKEIDINPILFENGDPVIVDAKFYVQ